MLSGSSSDCLCFSTERKTRHVTTTYLAVPPDVQRCTRTHTRAQTHNICTYGSTTDFLCLAFMFEFYRLVQSKRKLDFFHLRLAQKQGRNTRHHSHLLTELTISLPRSEIGSGEKHTIRNHYSAPNCRWQAWARQMRKWKDYNTISLSCTHLLIHLPGLNKCIHLKMIWQTVPTAWIRDTAAAEKNIIYLWDVLHR